MLIRMRNNSKMAAKLAMLSCLAWMGTVQCSVLVPTYVLPPASFNQQRDQRSLPNAQGMRTLARLAGGHLRLNATKNFADHAKNNFAYVEKEAKGYDDKFAGVVVKTENQNVGWNQGQWDDGMLMSSAGNGKEKNKQKQADDDEDKKTLADQVAEGKYGLIQKELFSKTPSRPGVISYAINPETKGKDNESNMGGLKSDEIWLAEDHLLVLKGGSFPDHNAKPDESAATWPPIDAYRAPPRQVKIPQNPEVPPPFPVRLSDDGPLVFLTPNGSVPAPLFPARPPGAGFGAFPSPPFPYPPQAAPSAQGTYPANFAPGGSPFPIAPFPFFPPRNESEPPFKFPGSLNASFPGGLPPGASFLPPPGNLTDLYDEDDPSIYYPPPYSFSYRAENTSKVPAGPLVPGIVLPPPPDFFAPLNPPTTVKSTAHVYPPTPSPPATVMKPHKPHKSVSVVKVDNSKDTSSTPTPKTSSSRPAHKTPNKVVIVTKPVPTRITQTTHSPSVPTIKSHKTAEKTPLVLHKPIKTTLKPVNVYYPDKNYYEENSVSQSPRPFLIYGPPDGRSPINQYPDKTYVTSTPIPLRAYYGNDEDNAVPQLQFAKQNLPTVTRVRPDYIQSTRQNGKSVASFYFYEEPASKIPTTTPQPVEYFDGRNYYQTIKGNGQLLQDDRGYDQPVENGFAQNVDFRPIPSREPSPFFFIPQRQGSRTLTQEYFSVQKPNVQNNYIPQAVLPQQGRPDNFYEQIASIQQTIDYYTTRRPKINIYQPNPYREPRQKPKPTPRPVYQFSFQNNNARPEQNRFRAPQMDSEPFRPMVTYSVPFNLDYQSTPQTVFSEQKVTTETTQPSKYYTTASPNDYDYEDVKQDKKTAVKSTHKGSVTSRPILATPSPKPRKLKLSNPTTKNPVDHAYYTKHEENLFDDITKNYFNIFGQKIENPSQHVVSATATEPIKHIEVTTLSTPLAKYRQEIAQPLRIDQQIISLASDTQVNYRQPRPLLNPESEFIPIVNPEIQAKYEADQKRLKEQTPQKHKVKNVEIIKPDYEINEGQQFANDQIDILRPIINNQYIQHMQSNVRFNKDPSGRGRHQVAEGRPGSLVAYRLPGEGAHVYFLTPQPVRHEFRSGEEISALS